MVDRAGFLASLVLATGGLDVWSSPSPAPTAPPAGRRLRVLLGDGAETAQSLDDRTFIYRGKRYRGRAVRATLPDGRDAVIAQTDLESYLAGVVPIEASPGWPAAALQVQAIVARTYALQRLTLSRPYDVTVADADQHFGGIEVEHASTTAAVTATAGRTLGYLGGPASVFYSSCCGGHTADAAELWGHNTLPYLRGVPDPHCAGAPDYRWTRSGLVDRVAGALGTPAIAGFDLEPGDSSGRPRAVVVHAAGGDRRVSMSVFRTALGPDLVRSLWIARLSTATTQAGNIVNIEGLGRGHGVGLCQWGARFMASDGADAAAILAFYFPGTAVIGA